MLQRTMALYALLLILMGVGVMFLALRTSQTRCEQSQEIRAYILEATDRGIKTLPTISYYKTHPDELRTAMETLQHQHDAFATPLNCSLIPYFGG